MLDPYTMRDGGILEMDDGRAPRDGPRIFDPKAGEIRFAGGDGGDGGATAKRKAIQLADIRAVAVVWAERNVRIRIVNEWATRVAMVHSVVLVPRESDVDPLLDALATTPGIPVTQQTHLVSSSVDAVSTSVFNGSALESRRLAKAIGRTMHLPVVEIYGGICVYRPVDALDLRMRDWMKLQTTPLEGDPGPPTSREITIDSQSPLKITWSRLDPSNTNLFLGFAILAFAMGVPLFWVAPFAAMIAVPLGAAILYFAMKRRKPTGSYLVIDDERIVVTRDHREDAVTFDALEMLRVDDATLILIDRDYETRFDLPTPEAAAWMRSAIEHRLSTGLAPKAPYR